MILTNKDELNFSKTFTAVAKSRKEKVRSDELLKILTEEYDDLSKRFERSQIQESGAVRSTLRARKLAALLISDRGELDLALLQRSVILLKKHLYFLGPARLEEALRQQHLLISLEHLLSSKNAQNLIKQFSKPQAHAGAENVIRETLDLPYNTVIHDAHVKQAALSSWLSYMRQSVGSCFATAPAIIIQAEQPDQFLIDLKEMLDTGRIKRVSEGNEIHAPFSASWGVGDLRKPLIIETGKESDYKEMGYAPGILEGLQAAGVIDADLKLKERVEITRDLVVASLHKLQGSGLYFVTTAEAIFKSILMDYYQINEKILADWLKRPRDMVFGGLMLQMPRAGKGQKGTGEACSNFMSAMEVAKSSFKRMSENALLKTWEFTLASFADTKANFSKWNLYVSLGFDHEEKGGIGFCLYESFKDRLDRANRKVHEYQEEYEILFSQLKYMEGRVRSASTEKEIMWLKAEYQSKLNEFNTFEIMRNREHYRAERMARLFSHLIDRYIDLFPRYFQEVYDAEVHEALTGIWDDRPAGFRLLFKHGRMNTAQWSRIDSPNEYSDALSSFFSLTESEISHSKEFEGLEQDLSDMITRVIQHVKTKEFLETAMWRMARHHHEPMIKDPLNHLEHIAKKPWAYTSGGNLNTLVTCYFNLSGKPKESERFVDSEMELLVYIAEVLKQLPGNITDSFMREQEKRMLMHSPTHAFNLKPGYPEFKKTWQNDAFTFTWVRDELVYPMQSYWASYVVSMERYEAIREGLLEKIPLNYQPRFREIFRDFPGEMSPSDLALYFMQKTERDNGMQQGGSQVLTRGMIDTYFLNTLPLISPRELLPKIEKILAKVPGFSASWKGLKELVEPSLISAHELVDQMAALILQNKGDTSFDQDYMSYLVEAARKEKWLPPAPIVFADTNWTSYHFTFLVSPSSEKLELWRTDRLGLKGAPMEDWKPWLDGSKKSPTWGLLTHPYEYKK